jgi:hypothetical protein
MTPERIRQWSEANKTALKASITSFDKEDRKMTAALCVITLLAETAAQLAELNITMREIKLGT